MVSLFAGILVQMHDHFVIEEDEALIERTMIGRRQCYSVSYMIDAARSSFDGQDVGGVDEVEFASGNRASVVVSA